jgi:hypothetical protein
MTMRIGKLHSIWRAFAFMAGSMLMALPVAAQEPCLATPAWERLRQVYPDGVPGRHQAEALRVSDDPAHLFVIPTVVHVMHNNGIELAIDADWCQAQLDATNQAFGRYGIGANEHPDGETAGIMLALAQFDPNGLPTEGFDQIEYIETTNFDIVDEEAMKKATQWDPCRYLNIWVVINIDGTGLAYAYFPEQVACTWYDGVVVQFDRFSTQAVSGLIKGEGDVVTHEVGHFLGLDHTWGRDNNTTCDEEDGCEDTPLCSGAYFAQADSCGYHPMQCGLERQIENYMDYSADPCRNMFTKCQVKKMRNALLTYRPTLVSTSNLVATGVANILDTLNYSGNLLMYPNPVMQSLFIQDGTADENGVSIQAFDFAGNLVLERDNFDARGGEAVDVSTLEGGWYHFVLRSTSRYQRRTILIAH